MELNHNIIANAMIQKSEGTLAQKTQALSGGGQSDKIRRSAEDFEAVFLSQMLKSMTEGIKADEVFGGGSAEETFKVLLNDEYGKVISRAGGIGLADQVERELLKLQEVQ